MTTPGLPPLLFRYSVSEGKIQNYQSKIKLNDTFLVWL